MIYLLDTHAFIWAILKTDNLSKNSREIISSGKNQVYVSTLSFWEISLKTKIGKFIFENIDIKDFPQYAKQMDFSIIGLQENESISFHELPIKKNHKDPFDRMLIWQAICRDMTIISKDDLFEQYKIDGLRLIW